jgi:hypothetical protein
MMWTVTWKGVDVEIRVGRVWWINHGLTHGMFVVNGKVSRGPARGRHMAPHCWLVGVKFYRVCGG